MSQECDVLVIGAGLYGIAAARFYLDVHPDSNLVVLDRDNCVGGTWNRRRLYPTFYTQIGLGHSEFSDRAMARPADGVQHELFEAKYQTDYLEDYVDNHLYNGETLRSRIKLNQSVTCIEKVADIWQVSSHDSTTDTLTKYTTRKLMIATGLTSKPKIPNLPFRESPGSPRIPLIDQSSFGSSNVLNASELQRITVLGGAKSAADMVYACVKAGKTVTWIVRESGSGPAAFMSAEGRGGYNNSPEIAATRLMGSFGSSWWLRENWWTRFLNLTWLGRWLQSLMWGTANAASRAPFKSEKLMQTAKQGFQDLEPDMDLFWVTGGLGLIQHDDFWSVIAEAVQIYRADISHVTSTHVHLADAASTAVRADALLLGIGWEPSHDSLFTLPQKAALGLPYDISFQTPEEAGLWDRLEESTLTRILRRFPVLHKSPTPAPKDTKHVRTTPYRLYKVIAPQHDHSIVFLGQVRVPNAFSTADCQAIWATAWLDSRVGAGGDDDMMQKEIAEFNVFDRLRYPLHGLKGNFLHYDCVGYCDSLMREVGLAMKTKGWWMDWTAPCRANDYNILGEQYLKRYGGGREHADMGDGEYKSWVA